MRLRNLSCIPFRGPSILQSHICFSAQKTGCGVEKKTTLDGGRNDEHIWSVKISQREDTNKNAGVPSWNLGLGAMLGQIHETQPRFCHIPTWVMYEAILSTSAIHSSCMFSQGMLRSTYTAGFSRLGEYLPPRGLSVLGFIQWNPVDNRLNHRSLLSFSLRVPKACEKSHAFPRGHPLRLVVFSKKLCGWHGIH